MFEDTDTWYSTIDYVSWQNKTNGTEINVSDPKSAASKFENYADNYWYKI